MPPCRPRRAEFAFGRRSGKLNLYLNRVLTRAAADVHFLPVPDDRSRRVLDEVIKLGELAVTFAGSIDPRRAARDARFGELVVDALMLLRTLPLGTPETLSAQNLWMAIERCRTCLLTHEASAQRDAQELRDALVDVRTLSAKMRVALDEDAKSRP